MSHFGNICTEAPSETYKSVIGPTDRNILDNMRHLITFVLVAVLVVAASAMGGGHPKECWENRPTVVSIIYE